MATLRSKGHRALRGRVARRRREAEPAYLLADFSAPRNVEADRLFAEAEALGDMGARPEPTPGPAGTIRGDHEADREAGQ